MTYVQTALCKFCFSAIFLAFATACAPLAEPLTSEGGVGESRGVDISRSKQNVLENE